MDLNTLRSLVTLLGFLAFLLIAWRAWRTSARPGQDAAARLPFDDERPLPDAAAPPTPSPLSPTLPGAPR